MGCCNVQSGRYWQTFRRCFYLHHQGDGTPFLQIVRFISSSFAIIVCFMVKSSLLAGLNKEMGNILCFYIVLMDRLFIFVNVWLRFTYINSVSCVVQAVNWFRLRQVRMSALHLLFGVKVTEFHRTEYQMWEKVIAEREIWHYTHSVVNETHTQAQLASTALLNPLK